MPPNYVSIEHPPDIAANINNYTTDGSTATTSSVSNTNNHINGSIDAAEVASASNINTDGTATYSQTASTRALSTPYTNGGDPHYYSDSYEEILDENSRKHALELSQQRQESESPNKMQLSQRHCQHHHKHNQVKLFLLLSNSFITHNLLISLNQCSQMTMTTMMTAT